MTSIKELLDLAKNESGKFFVLDENGSIAFVIMGHREYEELKAGSEYARLTKRIENLAAEAEDLNRKILDAQKDDLLEEVEAELPVAAVPVREDNLYIEPIDQEID